MNVASAITAWIVATRLARVPHGKNHQSTAPGSIDAQPLTQPAMIFQNAIWLHFLSPVIRRSRSKPSALESRPIGSATSMGCVAWPRILTRLSMPFLSDKRYQA